MTPSPLPANLKTGILHLGLGAFHRAHQAAFTQDAIAAAGGDWGIEAVSMRNPHLAEVLNRQEGRYTLIERHADGPKPVDMTVIRSAMALPGNQAGVAARMADPEIRIVTITVTEKGYGADIGSRSLNRADPGVAQDLAGSSSPSSLPGLICAGLAQRRAAGNGGLTLMSCDNLPDNGHLLRAVVLEMARDRDAELAAWIEETCRFPCSMVDRITPAASEETFALAGQALGRPDPAAIETEPFRQWVIEDSFAGPRPDWEAAGALVVPDVAPFETMKLRLLNGAHSLLAYLGALADLPAVRDVMADEVLRKTVRGHMEAVSATLPELPGFEAGDYADALIARFENKAIDHRCLQIAMDGSQKLAQRIFAPAKELLERGGDIRSCALAAAAWIRFAEGRSDGGAELELNDPLAAEIRAALAAAGSSPAAQVSAIAALPGLAHQGVLAEPRFAAETAEALALLQESGVRRAAGRG